MITTFNWTAASEEEFDTQLNQLSVLNCVDPYTHEEPAASEEEFDAVHG